MCATVVQHQWAETLETIRPQFTWPSCTADIKKSWDELSCLFPLIYLHHCLTKLTTHRFYTTLMYLKCLIDALSLSFTHPLLIRKRFTAHNPNMQLVYNCRPCGWEATLASLINIWFLQKEIRDLLHAYFYC